LPVMFGTRGQRYTMKDNVEIRLANFMDSCLSDLDKKGNLWTAPTTYNPDKFSPKVVHFTPCEGDLAYKKMFAAYNIEIFSYIVHRSKFKLFNLFLTFCEVLKKFKQENINLVRGRLPYLGSIIGCLAGRLLGVPSVVSLGGNNRIPQERDNTYQFNSKWISYTVEKIVLYVCDMIIAPNRYTKNYVATLIGAQRAHKKVRIIPWRITPAAVREVDQPEIFSRFGLNPEVPYILVVGFLNKYKYSDIMFQVAAAVLRARPTQVQFVFCGDGPLREFGQAYLQKFSQAHFLGWQPNDVVQSLMRHAKMILVPMSGFVLFEAASLGKPVIASNIEWHGEIIADGVTGFLVTPVAVNEWVRKIEIVLKDPGLAERLGDNLSNVFRAQYDQNSLINQEIALYHSLVAGKRDN
jgi:glycosyltransferase involved in cell wall biosynthesis